MGKTSNRCLAHTYLNIWTDKEDKVNKAESGQEELQTRSSPIPKGMSVG